MVKSTAPRHGNPDTYSSTYIYAGTYNDTSPNAYSGTYHDANPNSYSGTYHDAGPNAYSSTNSNAGSRPDANTYSRAFACSGRDDYTITATGAALRTFHREDRLRV